ncbi:hypothetical protein ACQKND_16425 [Viridibacillus arvi]|uniref:hypothetical protein n=1 Tax=Viridibacillus arvi TaxID=263475 RepID=UPI003CFF5DF8
MLFRIVTRETAKSKNVIHENLTYREMLIHFPRYREVYEFKMYQSENGSFWERNMHYIKGELVRFANGKLVKNDKQVMQQPYRVNVSTSDIFDKLRDAAPSHNENPFDLFYKIILSKYDLKVVHKEKQ